MIRNTIISDDKKLPTKMNLKNVRMSQCELLRNTYAFLHMEGIYPLIIITMYNMYIQMIYNSNYYPQFRLFTTNIDTGFAYCDLHLD